VVVHVADTNLVSIPDQIEFTAAASLGCRFATAYHALTARAKLTAGEWLAVIGVGGVGLSAVMIAKALGARVIAVDRHPEALEVAGRLGADHVVQSSGASVPAAIQELTGGGSHVAIDAVGSEETCTDSILSLRRRGRHVQVGLLPPVDGHPRVPMERAIMWELDLLGSHGMPATDYPTMLSMIERGDLRPQELIERVVTLREATKLLPQMDTASPAGITLIDLQS
jgi:alcohol dehydrogenase